MRSLAFQFHSVKIPQDLPYFIIFFYINLAKIRFQEAIKNIKLAFTLNQKVC